MRTICALGLFFFAIPCFAQSLNTPKPKLDKKWLALSIASHAAAAWDTEETISTVKDPCQCGVEVNPLARPLVNLPRPAYRITSQVLVVGTDWLSWKMKYSKHRWMRKVWWLPPALQIGGNIFGATYSHTHRL